MKINLEESARNYIIKKSPDKAITLGVGKRDGASCGCSVGGGIYPYVKLGVSPFDVNVYVKNVIDGIEIYYPDSVANVFKTVTVKVEGILFYKQLLALGSQ